MPRVKLFDEQQVLKKAMNLFWKKGFYATSIQDLVNHLGINRASLYDTYGGKKELFDKAFQHYIDTNTERIKKFFDSQDDVKIGLRDLLRTSIDQSISDEDNKGCFVVNTTTELLPNDCSVEQILQNNKKNFERIFYDYLKEGVERGQISKKKNLKTLASILFSFYGGLRVSTKVSTDEKELLDSIDIILTLLD